MIHQNVDYSEKITLSGWRKISLGSWRPTGDSSVNCDSEIVADSLLDLIRSDSQGKIKLNHLVAKACALAIKENPQINSVVRFGNIFRRKNIDLFFHVHTPLLNDDLSGIKLENVDHKNLDQIANEFELKISQVKTQTQNQFSEVKALYKFIPGSLSKFFLDLSGWISYSLNWHIPRLKIPKDPFGSLMITNVGSFGIEGGYTIIAPYTRVPAVIGIGKIKKKAIMENDQIVIRQILRLGMTFDHRLVDGYQIAGFIKSLKHYLEFPKEMM